MRCVACSLWQSTWPPASALSTTASGAGISPRPDARPCPGGPPVPRRACGLAGRRRAHCGQVKVALGEPYTSARGRTGSASAGASSPAPGRPGCPGSAPGTRPGRSAPAAALANMRQRALNLFAALATVLRPSMPGAALQRRHTPRGAPARLAPGHKQEPQPAEDTQPERRLGRRPRGRAPWSSQSRTA